MARSPALAPALAAPRAAGGRAPAKSALQKGQLTRATILEAALAQASHMGLEGLSIGALADQTGMSKSGVFAHFGSREELQIAVVAEYHRRFEEEVFFSALREPRGLPRLRALFEHWVRQVAVELESGCIYISGAVEFDDRPGPVRDALVTMVKAWHAALHKAIRLAVDEGHLRADAPIDQVLFELHGLILSLHHDARFLRSAGALEHARRGFDRVVAPDLTPAGREAEQAPKARKPRATRSGPTAR
ncbi:TetR/AcrR family transcriptional regulator [Inhella crocodyli]|uniref:TetR/AcrR family transcriptional regulator n=1 Tax=Inhella crocodyli TaxID=2499851 RepID=A0A437LLH0_9BURK|nr:TetR/AcrR family transcriptional regulator [Inhella crocodyli]RVT86266.1 TetR/AcrR family transcriptional regulator [Inhella crocodyli]